MEKTSRVYPENTRRPTKRVSHLRLQRYTYTANSYTRVLEVGSIEIQHLNSNTSAVCDLRMSAHVEGATTRTFHINYKPRDLEFFFFFKNSEVLKTSETSRANNANILSKNPEHM